MMVAVVLGGSFFGDNLSFISDTTIAACSTQGCEMRDKFRANFKIALPAALRDKRGVLSRIRVINGKEYLVFRR